MSAIGTCDNCAHAEWKTTTNGRRHPSGEGRCEFLRKHPKDQRLPASCYWVTAPRVGGGFIQRGHVYADGCVFKQEVTP